MHLKALLRNAPRRAPDAIVGVVAAALLAVALPATAATFALHGQVTYVEQETNAFPSPYRGPNSLSPGEGRETFDATVYLGVRLGADTEIWATPELDQGFGLDDTLGLAGFSSGEAYKVGRKRPYLRLPRAFVRETRDLGADREAAESGLFQFGGSRSADRVVITVGKFGVTDVFDASQYAHDPRGDFMNWTAIDAGTFDYAADAWGFTIGAAVEWYHGKWTLRVGAFDLSSVPNSEHLEPAFHEFQMIGEVERRYSLGGRAGRLLVTAYDSRGRMGLLADAVRLAETTGGPVDIAAVRHYRSRTGVHATLEQDITSDLATFARAGVASGNVEAYEFTDIDRSASAGLALKGTRWHRVDDTVGLVGLVNGISADRERFLDAGGLGILVGDGRLPHPGAERIVETYYSARMVAQVYVTLDYQYVRNPAYNRDPSPVSIAGVRVHAQF